MNEHAPKSRLRWLRHAAVNLGLLYDAFHRFLARITGRLGKPMTAEIFFAVQHGEGVEIEGRVLLARSWRHPQVEDHAFYNLWQMVKRWATPERPYSLVRVSAGGEYQEQRADREGYFDVLIPLSEVKQEDLWLEFPESTVSKPIRHAIQVTGDHSRCLIISDVDDTVLVSHVGKTLRMVATTMFGNALTRQLFPGTSELYQALRAGVSPESERNPIAYVTSSPYNLHGLIQLIFEENDLPLGAFFMTNWGLDYDHWFRVSHQVHKSRSIRRALDWHPAKPAILIGDSSQHDAGIYVDMAVKHPGRVDLILIRIVSDNERIAELEAHAGRLSDSATELAFFRNTDEAAAILHRRGWINEEQLFHIHDGLVDGNLPLLDRLKNQHDH